MKKCLLPLVLILMAPVILAQIAGSAHDFSDEAWSNGQICIVCHTPHNADTTVTDSPLWNHAVTASTFTVYTSNTLNATVGQPDGISKLCLSCHDGTVALDSYGGNTGTTMIAARADFGTDLTNDHPISFTYDDTLASTDGGLFAPSTQATTLGGTIATDLLSGGQMECSSCHDVHNQYNLTHLLKIGNGHSALCLTCHDK